MMESSTLLFTFMWLCCVGGNIYSLTQIMASIKLRASLSGPGGTDDVIPHFDLKSFSLLGIIHDFLESHAYLMMSLTLFGACILFFIRAAALVYTWRLPSERKRFRVLQFLDIFTSIVYIDVQFFTFMAAILHNKVSLRLSDYIPLTMNAEVYFVPTSSMMINMASNTFLAFFLGTVLVYASSKVLHRRGGTEEEEVETLVQKVEQTKPLVISARTSLVLTLIVLTCSYIAMMTLPLMRVEYEGVAGELLTILHAPDAQRVRHYYVPTIGAKVIAATPTVETYGVVMAIAFYLLVVVAPFLFIVSAFALLLYVNKKAAVLNFIRAIFPWCGVDILIAGCVATWLEINMVLTWVIENSFPGLCDEIDELSRPGQTCIKLNVHLDIGFYFVLLATASFYLAYSLIRIYWC